MELLFSVTLFYADNLRNLTDKLFYKVLIQLYYNLDNTTILSFLKSKY